MKRLTVSPLLRLALRLDALLSATAGAATLAARAPLQASLDLGAPAVTGLGVFMLAYGLTLGVLAARPTLPRALVLTVAIGNGLWALGTAAFGLGGPGTPTAFGLALVLGQAAVVAALAELQFLGYRRSAAA